MKEWAQHNDVKLIVECKPEHLQLSGRHLHLEPKAKGLYTHYETL